MDEQVDLAEIASRGGGQAISRLTRIEIILDDLEDNGDFTLDLDYLRITAPDGEVGWQDEFETVAEWVVGASFSGAPNAASRLGFTTASENDWTFGRMRLTAISSDRPVGAIDEATRQIQPREEVRLLYESDFGGAKVPILLQRENCYFINTFSPTEECWASLMPDLLGMQLNQGVMFRSYSHSIREGGMTSTTDEQWTVIQEEELPVDRIRLVAPPDWDRALRFTLPASPQPWSLRVIQGERRTLPGPDPGSTPPTITLQPGELVELMHGKPGR